jgi:hypothetical protein
MKIELIVPNSLNEITLGQYQKYLKLGELTETELSYKMIEIFCGLKPEHIRLLKAKDVQDIVGIISQMFESKPSLVHTFKMNDVEYGFINNLDEMSFGEYIDLDTFIGDWDNIEKAMAVLYRPNTVTTGDITEIDLSKQTIFPLSQPTTDIFRGNNNEQDVLNTQLAVLNRLTMLLRKGNLHTDLYQLDGTPNCEPFYERFENRLAGWACTFDVFIQNDIDICS